MLSLSPYFQTSLVSSNSILYFVRVGNEMEGISPAFIWSYYEVAILSSAIIDFFSSSSLDIEVHHHFFIVFDTTDIQQSPALSGIGDLPHRLRRDHRLPDFRELSVHLTHKIRPGNRIGSRVGRYIVNRNLPVMAGIIVQLDGHLPFTVPF